MDKELLKILACPECKSDLKYKDNTLTCTKCKKVYKIEDNIPIIDKIVNINVTILAQFFPFHNPVAKIILIKPNIKRITPNKVIKLEIRDVKLTVLFKTFLIPENNKSPKINSINPEI